MPLIRIAAGAAAALALASYACAALAEAQLGETFQPQRGNGRPAAGLRFSLPRKTPAGRFRQTLDRVQPDAATATRGAAESQVYKRAAPAVVFIVTDEGLGSGALISADGEIVTNLHVVKGAKHIGVVFKPAAEGVAPAEKDLRRAKVLKVDEVADLALIQVEGVPPGVQPLVLGDSSGLQVGADVQAIGHPDGESWTYTRGIVSQIRRAYDWADEDKVPHEATVIQTQTPINPGNSGGPLLDDEARIVGINSFFDAKGEGINFAVSVEDVKSFLARSHDRAAPPPKAQAECDWKTLSEERSAERKGLLEQIDTDCDGVGDAIVFTPDNKRAPMLVMRSEGDTGKIDTTYFDTNRDGNFDFVLYDTDGDGQPDLRGEYRKGEDEPFRWEKISGSGR